MITAGQNYLEAGDVDKAAQIFQEAINVDPENGIAYFYLAKVDYQKVSFDDALGLLDKAETLLKSYPDWLIEVTKLREMIAEAKQTGQTQTAPGSPASDIYY